MIRPLTCLCMLSAAGAGLYLYQQKHQSHVLDRDIMAVVKQTTDARDRTSLLRAEWALLNEPDRLASLAARHLQLKPLDPGQFVKLADLPGKLPPVMIPPPPAPATDQVPVAAAAPAPPVMAQIAPVPATSLASPAAAAVAVAARAAPAVRSAPVQVAAAPTQPTASQPAPGPVAKEPAPTVVAATAPSVPATKPARQLAAAQPAHRSEPPAYSPSTFAPIVSAYAGPGVSALPRAPTIQRVEATAALPAGGSFLGGGSALGAGARPLPPPVPVNGTVASASALGGAYGR